MKNTIKTYEPDNSLKKGYRSMFKEIFNEIKDSRWLTWQLTRRNFFSFYRQSIIGVFWAFIIPGVSVSTFIVLNRAGIFTVGHITVPYSIYAVSGIAFWQLLSSGLVASSESLAQVGQMVSKINFSRKSLVFACMGKSLLSFLVQFVLLCILFIIYGFKPSIFILLLPIIIIPIILLTIGLGFILSLVNAIIRDVGAIISTLLTFLMFLTPIWYAKPTTGFFAVVTKYNPLYYLISVPRELILMGTISGWKGYLASSIMVVFIFIVCLIIFHLTETRIAERI